MLMNDLPWFSERREHQGPAETSQELLLRAERGLGETASNPAHLGVGGEDGGKEGLSPRKKAALSNLRRSKEGNPAWPGAETGRVWRVEGGGLRRVEVGGCLGSARGWEIPWMPEGEVSVINRI